MSQDGVPGHVSHTQRLSAFRLPNVRDWPDINALVADRTTLSRK
jgi:hypothetical protein